MITYSLSNLLVTIMSIALVGYVLSKNVHFIPSNVRGIISRVTSIFGKSKGSTPTMWFQAAFRYAGTRDPQPNVGCNDYLAKYFLPFHVRIILSIVPHSLFLKYSEAKAFGLYHHSQLRSRNGDKAITDFLETFEDIKDSTKTQGQILILSGGYATHFQRFGKEFERKGCNFIELDLPEAQKEKLRLAKQNVEHFDMLSSKRVHFLPIDYNKMTIQGRLEGTCYDKNLPTLVLFEGVCMYLEEDVVKSVLRFVHENTPIGSTLYMDALVKAPPKTITDSCKTLSEPVKFVLPESKNYTKSVEWFESQSFSCDPIVKTHADSSLIDASGCLNFMLKTISQN